MPIPAGHGFAGAGSKPRNIGRVFAHRGGASRTVRCTEPERDCKSALNTAAEEVEVEAEVKAEAET
ncbi:hypothetical protein [Trinickia soli]|uniref:hypothetical protein n=1 Tax=Trinickia soli TaxID=380675 RepID=UPI0012B6F2CA